MLLFYASFIRPVSHCQSVGGFLSSATFRPGGSGGKKPKWFTAGLTTTVRIHSFAHHWTIKIMDSL